MCVGNIFIDGFSIKKIYPSYVEAYIFICVFILEFDVRETVGKRSY